MADYNDQYDEDDPERYGLDGLCQSCGRDLDDDPEGDHDAWHSECWRCWREAKSSSGARS